MTYNQKVKENEARRKLLMRLSTNLSAVGRSITLRLKRIQMLTKAITNLKQAVKVGEQVRTSFSHFWLWILQNSFAGFQTLADRGNIKISRETVTVNASDLAKYRDEITLCQTRSWLIMSIVWA